jgi:hypothetical protein
MRMLMGVWFVVLFSSAAQAQLYSFQDMINMAIQQCIVQRPGQPDAPRFCNCWVNRWVGLWDENDKASFIRGVSTPHMVEMERVAAAQCGGG